ncbi:hypothetical protein BZG01_00135 [Labilibaculum manganireducens]|uniref:Uncharacterized protein n=1 Tax=Labilibaculum manganireducens TaxID=1940525 RepID=A0A2N3IGG7_9BACT|nr:hypothetical protein [Labilibaculum manganireducens]PKQ69381.1 hypothetical protein BZG01_00135 [Labilibaculum manganireducens]
MLNDIYKDIKAQLNTIATSEDCQWYNVQYEQAGWAFNAGFFVEFPDALQFDDISKMKRRSPLKIRVHVYNQNVQTTEGISDSDIDAHEAMALQVLNILDLHIPTLDGEEITSKLIFRGWQHWHRYQGWMITFIDFECKKML